MHKYFGLTDDIKYVFNYRVIYLISLMSVNIYCVTIMSLKLYEWFLIPVLVGNFISIAFSIIHLWMMIYHNKLYSSDDDCFVIGVFEVGANLIIIISGLFYAVEISKNLTQLIIPEFVVFGLFFGIYSIIIFIYVIFFVYHTVLYLSGVVISTVNKINERNKNYENY